MSGKQLALSPPFENGVYMLIRQNLKIALEDKTNQLLTSALNLSLEVVLYKFNRSDGRVVRASASEAVDWVSFQVGSNQ